MRPGLDLADQTLAHQGTIGNPAVLRLLAQRAESITQSKSADPRTQEADRGRMSASPTGERAFQLTQPRLAVGAVNDPLEQEADCVADQVMRTPERDLLVASAPKRGQGLQKQPAGLQSAVSEAPAVVHEVLRSPGQPLDAAARAYFEPRFGHRFGDVRIHADARAAESARSIDAAAYTVATHVAFDAGRYEPHALQGRRLLAHELAHVVQQRANSPAASVLQRDKRNPKPDPKAKKRSFDRAAIEAIKTGAEKRTRDHQLHPRESRNVADLQVPVTVGRDAL